VAKDEERKEKVESFERENQQLANRLRRELVLKENQTLVEAASMPLRKYLMASVVPALVDGLLDVCRVQPSDPIDHLAEFLFNYATVEAEGL
jgi:adenylate kinase